MRDLVILCIHLLTTAARLATRGGLRSVVAESVLLKHQLLILNRSRQRAVPANNLIQTEIIELSEDCANGCVATTPPGGALLCLTNHG